MIITTTAITTTPTTATIITNDNRTEDRKPSGLMLPLQLKTMGILETVPCRERALCKSVPKDHQQQCPGKSLHVKG
ncbi:hypothetical protein Tco_0376068 [Tanacetum coccineum]